MKISEFAGTFGCATITIRRAIDRGEIKAMRLGGVLYIPRTELAQLERRAEIDAATRRADAAYRAAVKAGS